MNAESRNEELLHETLALIDVASDALHRLEMLRPGGIRAGLLAALDAERRHLRAIQSARPLHDTAPARVCGAPLF